MKTLLDPLVTPAELLRVSLNLREKGTEPWCCASKKVFSVLTQVLQNYLRCVFIVRGTHMHCGLHLLYISIIVNIFYYVSAPLLVNTKDGS